MTEVKFYENTEDERIKFAVIFAKTQNKYIFCKHKDRDTWEIPGGHRENGEFDIEPICIYSVKAPDNLNHGEESLGMLFFADIKRFEAELHSEIEKIKITDEFPERWTYPDIQPYLIKEVKKRGYL